MTSFNWPASRKALAAIGLLGVQYFSWASHAQTLFNGLASPLFFALAAYLIVLASQYRVEVSARSLRLYSVFAAWIVFADARSGEFVAAFAMDTHWLILPVAALLLAQLLRASPQAFQMIQVGAAACIVNLLMTLILAADRYFHWHYPPIFGHIRHLGLSIGFMTVLLHATPDATGWVAVFLRSSRILGLAIVFWSGTRASVLAWACCIPVLLTADRKWARVLLLDTVAAIALSLIPDPALPHGTVFGSIRRSLGARSADELSSSRLGIWKTTLSGLHDIGRLWTGVGGNGFARLQVMHKVKITTIGHVHAHNIVIQSICDWGLIGFALFTCFVSQSMVRPVVTRLRDNDPTALSAVIYLLVTGMLDATLFHLEHLIYLAISLGVLMARRGESTDQKVTIPKAAVLLFIVALALVHTQALDYRIGLRWYFPTQ